ncbi:MAG: glycosyltransferase family 2 protein [Bacteroidia bacterium]|nr:MAG: glycosyltransferase family 2 protein [Bacteroidia bacterium]
MMLYLAISLWIFMVVRLLIATTNIITRQWLQSGKPGNHPKVSILIPARNEAKNIGTLLESIRKQHDQNFEVIVYDDLSEDETANIVDDFRAIDPRIRLIKGMPLPSGWLGKNHACHQLSKNAENEIFLFLDADVTLSPSLIGDALAHMDKYRLDLLSIFPQQIMKTWGEKVSVPIMNWVLVSLLPLILTRKSGLPAFAAANGQHMLFRSDVYKQYAFHKRFKNKAVEDIVIARYMKEQKLRIHTVLSKGQIKCRMYGGLKDALQGFSKNVLAFFGNNTLLAVTVVLITTFGFIPVWMAMGPIAALIYLLAALLLRLVVAVASRQNILENILTAPLQQIVFAVMVAKAIYNRSKKRNSWKGRTLNI